MSAQQGSRWSIAFGEWWGIPVRLHWLMLLFAVLAVGVTLDQNTSHGVLTAGVLLASVVLHEAAHCFSAIRLGGHVEAVVLSPIGGLQSPQVPDEPEPHLFVSLIGPMANLAVVLAASLALLFSSATPPELLPLLNPVGPFGMLDGSIGLVTLKLTLWINWTLFLLNLLPTYPFDGGAALRAVLWPLLGRRTAAVATAHTAQLASAALCVAALVLHKTEPQAVMPLWPPLVTLAVFVFFSARRDLALADSNDTSLGTPSYYPTDASGRDLSDTDWGRDGSEMVLVEHSNERSREQSRKRVEVDESYEDARVDDILARLHAQGYEQLSAEDRAILQRASQRYRSRQNDELEADD